MVGLPTAIAFVCALALPTLARAGPFRSPSGNIGCYINKQGVRCDIAKHSWKAPPKPKNCELDWGGGMAVDRKGRAAIVCAGDTTLDQGPELLYGNTIRKGSFTCASRTTGVRCVNRSEGHGFFISRQSYKLF